MTNYAKLFGGVFSRIEECTGDTPAQCGIIGSPGSPLYSRAVKMLDTFLEKKLDNSVLEDELVVWIDSKVLDDLIKDYTEHTYRGFMNPSIFTVLCFCGHLELAKWVSEKYPDMVIHDCAEVLTCDQSSVWRNYPVVLRKSYDFTFACEKGHIEVAKWLTKTFPEIVTIEPLNTAFRDACFGGSFEIVKWFVDSYASSLSNETVDKGFRDSCLNDHFELAEWLLKKYNIDVHGEDDEVFVQLCSTGSLERVKWFVEKYPETKDNEEGEAFLGACVEGNIDVVRWMIEKYGSDYGTGFIGYVLEEVCQKGNKEVVTILVDRWPTERTKSIFDKFFSR